MTPARIKRRLARLASGPVENVFRSLERVQASRGAVIDAIPPPSLRNMGAGVGTTTFGEWCYLAGIFHGLLFPLLQEHPIRMLDVGCGTGRLYLSAKPFLTDEDRYTGLDVMADAIERCRRSYQAPNVEFIHVPAGNGYYAANGSPEPLRWPLADGSMNLITALSVWTHLKEEDWRFYLGEVARVLAPGGHAFISFFVMDEHYRPERKTGALSRFYPQPEDRWVFDAAAYGSAAWFCPHWAEPPERAIAVARETLDREATGVGLRVESFYPGQWKDMPGAYFQDIAILAHQQVASHRG